MKLAIVINEFLTAPTARMLNVSRLASFAAAARPGCEVHLLFPAGKIAPPFEARGLSRPKNLFLHPLPAVRKMKGHFGLTLNVIFYHSCLWELQKLQPDVVFSASFHKLWKFLLDRRSTLPRARFAYEVHGMAEINPDPSQEKIADEIALFKRTDVLWCTTGMLRELLSRRGITAEVLPYGCPMNPDDFPPSPKATADGTTPPEGGGKGAGEKIFRLGYFGSVYPEQGVDWLVKNWNPGWGELHIAGGIFHGKNIFSRGKIFHRDVVKKLLPNVDALVIPALRMGRTPYVFFTKAHDYLALKRPIIAANLPPIAEVLRDGREALLFEPGDIRDFAHALEKIKTDGDLRARLVENSVKRARESSYEKSVEKFWELLEVNR